MNHKIVDRALENLEKTAEIHAEWKDTIKEKLTPEIDGKIKLLIDNNHIADCFAAVRKEVRKHHIPQLREWAQRYKPFMLIADRLYPNLKQRLRQANIDWLDGAGNIHFKHQNHFIWIDLHTTTPTKEKKNRAFTKTGLKVLFLFLHDEDWVNKTYREIAEAADVALGNIKYVLDGLKEKNFLIRETKERYKLTHKPELLNQWITAFTDELRPRLHVDNFEFLDETDQRDWKTLQLEEGTFWGGEPGADLLTENLKPAEYTLYTHKTKAALMTDYRLKPKQEGRVKVYKPYWTIKTEHKKTAPPLVIYTDLMTTGEPRNMNIADEIHERYLKHIT